MSAVNLAGTMTGAAAAMSNGTLALGYSGSGFLIYYFLGATAILSSTGIINSTTHLAGASGGAIQSVLVCAGLNTTQQYKAMQDMATTCRMSQGCRGYLDSALHKQLQATVTNSAAQQCSGRLYVAVTEARPAGQPDTPLLLGPNWADKQQLVLALRGSSYIPAQSGRRAALQLPWLPPPGEVYDGGFTTQIPCPPGVDHCIKVMAQAPASPGSDGDFGRGAGALGHDMNTTLLFVNALKSSGNDTDAGPLLPLNPEPAPAVHADIYPGLSGRLLVSPSTWNSYALSPPDEATLRYIYDVGRRDAGLCVVDKGLVSAAGGSGL